MPPCNANCSSRRLPSAPPAEECLLNDNFPPVCNDNFILNQSSQECNINVPVLQIKVIFEIIWKFLIQNKDKKKYKNYDMHCMHADFFKYCIANTLEWEEMHKTTRPYHGERLSKSETLTKCHDCGGKGETTCKACKEGMRPCYHCGDVGFTNHYGSHGTKSSTCHDCWGMGKAKCCFCHGSYSQKCLKCGQSGKIVSFYVNQPEITSVRSHHFTNKVIPEPYLKKCRGITVCQNTSFKGAVKPFSSTECKNKEILIASRRLVEDHRRIPHGYHLHKQAHSVKFIPAYKVVFEKRSRRNSFSGKPRESYKRKVFWIIGTNNLVYSPDYFLTEG